MAKITIIGSGAMGSACANILVDNRHDVTIYGIDQNELDDLQNGKNSKYFGDIELNKFKTTSNLKEALDKTEFVVLAIPTKFIASVYQDILNNLNSKAVIINVCKGFWPNTTKSLHAMLKIKAKNNEKIVDVVSLIGPSFAIEIVKRAITFVDAVGNNILYIQIVQNLFSNDYFKILVQTDVKGAEIGSIYKNIIAIASGMLVGLGYNINTQAALITMSLREIKKYCNYKKAKISTIYGLCGLGDLILTSTSDKSRNFSYGMNLALNKPYENITVEGVASIKNIYENICKKNILHLPIVTMLYEVIFLHKEPQKSVNELIKFAPERE